MSAETAPLRLMLADDHRMVRSGLSNLLARQPGWAVTAEADDGEELLGLVEADPPDVVVLDLNMPRMGGIEATRRIKADHPEIRVVVLSMHDEPEYVIRSLQAGADAYVFKQAEPQVLLEAIRTVAEGRKFFPSDVAVALSGMGAVNADDTTSGAQITPREREVLALVAKGKSNKEIADLLFVSPRTVETHRARLLKKLEARNTAELVQLALRFGLIEP